MDLKKIYELLDGDSEDLKVGLEMMKHLTLGEIFDIMKMLQLLSHTKNHAKLTIGGVDIDGRNWFIFRLFEIPEIVKIGYNRFDWSTWNMQTIRWIKKNRDLRPDRKKPFVIFNSKDHSQSHWISQELIEQGIIEKRRKK